MSELAGKTLTEQLLRLDLALKTYASKKDWQKLAQVNELLIRTLSSLPQTLTASERTAKQKLATTHQQVLTLMCQQRDELKQKMQQLQGQKDGLTAYQLTQSSE